MFFLYMEMRWFENFCQEDEFQQYFVIDQCPMFSFSPSKSDHFRISSSMMNFKSVWALTNVWCPLPLHQIKIILEFLSPWWISRMFDDWWTYDVLFPFINIAIFLEFVWKWWISTIFDHSPRSKLFLSSSKWDRFRISMTMMNLNNISSLTEVRCTFSLRQNEVILEFLWSSWISTIFDYWPTSDVLFFFIKMRSFWNFFEDEEFQQYFTIDEDSS